MRMESPRLLFVHAHPDDETLTTGATIAHYAARGAQVRVVTCTLGEEGEVIGERWAQLAVDQADQLGGFRIGELSAALNALGIDDPVFLGGAGRWRDSGMEGTPPRHRQRFIDADPRDAVGALVDIIRELRPHVVVTYDANGGYGHPDHIHAHEVTMAAVGASGGAEFPGRTMDRAEGVLGRDVEVRDGRGSRRARGRAAGVDPSIDRRRTLRLPRRRDRRGDGGCRAACPPRSRRCVRTRPRSPSRRTAGLAPCRTTWPSRSGQSSTTSLRRAHPASATTAGGRPTCWPG